MKDARGREIKYLRVSVTDRCNLRCKYCMPNGIECVEHKDILSFEEIRQIAVCGARLGITKIRLTGGEPLARKGCPELIRMLKEIPGIEKIAMTTNGTLVRAILPELVEAGLDEINISLDTLDAGTFAAITGQDLLPEVLLAIDAALAAGLKVKVNAVSMPDTDWIKPDSSTAAGTLLIIWLAKIDAASSCPPTCVLKKALKPSIFLMLPTRIKNATNVINSI